MVVYVYRNVITVNEETLSDYILNETMKYVKDVENAENIAGECWADVEEMECNIEEYIALGNEGYSTLDFTYGSVKAYE